MEGKTRETIGSRFGFILLAAGCAIGLGNVWRFPYVTGSCGGALFVLLYLFFLAILGFPVMVMELSIGRAAKLGLYGAFRDLPEKRPSAWRFPAGAVFTGNLLLMMMYTTVTGWMIAYFCAYAGNRMAELGTDPAAAGEYFERFLGSPAEMTGYMMIPVILGSIVCAAGLRGGVERVTKVLMSGLFLILAALCVHSLTLPGAAEGIRFYLSPDWENFVSGGVLKTVSAAMSQAFFTLSIGIGSIEIFGSYIGRERTLPGEALLIIACDTLVALLAGVVIFSACFSYGTDVGNGPGLVLVSLTGIFNDMPGGNFIGAAFFLFMSVAALTTVIAVFENLIAFLIDEWHFSRRKAALVNGIAIGILSIPCALGYNLLSEIHPLGGASTILDFEDWLVSGILLPSGAALTVLFCTWKSGWGWEKFLAEANAGKGPRFAGVLRIYMKYVLPLLILTLFALGILCMFGVC